MKKRPFFLLLLLSRVLAGCAIGYQARGSLSDVPGELRGKGFPGNASGGGRFILAEPGGRLQCDGQLEQPDVLPNPGSCEGEQGNGVLRCSDGRVVNFEWQASSCRSLRGSGNDAQGNRLKFRVDRR